MINFQSTLRTAPESCKNVSLQCYLVATVIHIQSQCSQICVRIHIFFTVWRHWSDKRNKKKTGTSVNAVCQRNPSMCHFEHACHRFASISYLDEFQRSIINTLVIVKVSGRHIVGLFNILYRTARVKQVRIECDDGCFTQGRQQECELCRTWLVRCKGKIRVQSLCGQVGNIKRWNLEGSEHGKEHWFCMCMAFLLLPKNTHHGGLLRCRKSSMY